MTKAITGRVNEFGIFPYLFLFSWYGQRRGGGIGELVGVLAAAGGGGCPVGWH